MTLDAEKSDGVLVGTVLSGNTDAFGILVERHLARMHAIAYAQVGLDADVDDIVQDAFVAAFRSLDTLRNREQFGSWLAVIVKNAARQRIRRKVRDKRARDEFQEQAMERVFEDPADAERRHIIAEAIDALAEDHREALLLYYFTGKSTVDIGLDLGVSRETVKKRLQRARDALGQQLAEGAGEFLQTRIPHAAQARRITLAVVGITPVWIASAGSIGAVSAAGLSGGSLMTKKALLVCGVMAVLAGTASLIITSRQSEGPAPSPGGVSDAPETLSLAKSQAAESEDLANPREEDIAATEPEPARESERVDSSTAPPEYRAKQSTMAGGNAQRTGFYNVPAPLEKPSLRWSYPLGLPGETFPGVMPTVALDGSILADYGRKGENFFGLFSAEGELLWEVGPHDGKRSLGTPTLLSNGVIVHAFNPTTGILAAYDPQTGEPLWTLEGVHARHEAPAVDSRDSLYVTTKGPAGLARIDGYTGEVIWPKVDALSEIGLQANASPTLSLDESTLYAGTRPRVSSEFLSSLDDGDPMPGRIFTVDAEDGALRWTYLPEENFRPSEEFNFDPNWGSPVVGADSTVYIQDAWTGVLIALEDQGTAASERWNYDPRWSGEVLRFEEREDSVYTFETPYNSHDAPRMVATDGENVYMGNFGYPASIHAVAADDGAMVWRTALEGNPVVGSPAVTPDAVYVLAAGDDEMAGTNALYCLDRESGAILWDYPVAGPHGDTGETIGLGPDGTIYVLTSGIDGEQSVLIALR